MTVWVVVWVVLMMFWLFGAGYTSYDGPNFNAPRFGTTCLVPWACVLILGLVVFGAISSGSGMVR